MTTQKENASQANWTNATLRFSIAALAACTFMAPSAAAAASCGADLSTQMTTQLSRPAYHAGVLNQPVTIKNNGGTTKGTLYFVIDSPLPQGVSAQSFTWTSNCEPGALFFRIYLGPNNEIAAGASLTFSVGFMGTNKAFPFTYHVIKGTGLPNPHVVPGDFDGDRIADWVFYNPVTSVFTVTGSKNNATNTYFYGSPNLPYRFTVGDFDGDLKEDLSLYDPVTALWSWRNSSNGSSNTVQIGSPGDIPVPGDYDGDGYTDIAVYHQQTSTFIIWRSSDHVLITKQLGLNGDIPVPGDYDGDGTTDIAVYNGGLTRFTMLYSSTQQVVTFSSALLAGIPFAADMDGNGKDDMCVYNQFAGIVTWTEPSALVIHQKYVGIGKPVVADWGGDRMADIGIFSPSNAAWVVDSQMMNPGPNQVASFTLGTPNQDVPVMAVPAALNFPKLLPW